MSSPVIVVEGLGKTFKRRRGQQEVCAVRDVNLRVEAGSVVAFVGPNGAGKTTTIYSLLGLLQPDRGSVRVFDQPAGSMDARRRTGFQTEIFHTYGFRTAEQVLRFYGTLSEMSDGQIAEAVPRQLSRLGLGEAAQRRVNGFSKGMVQRLGLAQALLHGPELLVLDEPTTGLDPEGRKLVADIIREEKAQGTTIFLSSHILSDVERVCDHVVILRGGSVVFSESMAKLRGAGGEWEIEILDGAAGGRRVVRCTTAEKNATLLRLLNEGADIGGVREAGTLEDIYMRYAGGTSDG